MIFGHAFDFKDEPQLNDKHTSFQENGAGYGENKTIEVLLSVQAFILKRFTYSSPYIDLSGQQVCYHSNKPLSQSDKNYSWAMEVQNVLTLLWDAKEEKIYFSKEKNYSKERLQFWVYHTFFPFVLELTQTYHVLHVGSVEIEGNPVVFSAFSFGGKSTMTDYFIQKGHTMLSDDTLAIDQQGTDYYAMPAYPFHRPYREPESLGYAVTRFATEPKPLRAVYRLERSEPDAVVSIKKIKGIEKFKAFHYSTFINFSFMRKRRFTFFTEMAKHVPVYSVTVPWNLGRLEEVYVAIVEHEKTL